MKKQLSSKLLAAGFILAGSILTAPSASAQAVQQIGNVFYIELENHNWTQPNGNIDNASATIEQIKGNPAAPFINSLVTPGNANAANVSYTNKYYNVLATPTGVNSIHPSEPNYIWQEGGSNYGVAGDADPGTGTGGSYPQGNNFSTATQSLSNLLQSSGQTWTAYAEDRQIGSNAGIVPIHGQNGTTGPTNPYYGTTQYDYAPKHVGQLFFQNTNDPSKVANYAALSQLQTDLANGTVAKYNVITPNQFNDMHSALSTDFIYNGVTYTHGTDAQKIALGDHFLSVIVPQIEASSAFGKNGEIVIWNDEVEPQVAGDTAANDYSHSSTEIVISPLAKGNAYHNDSLIYDHTSDLRTLQEVFSVGPAQGDAFLGQAATDPAGQNDLADLYQPGVVQTVPEPTAMTALSLAALALCVGRFRQRRSDVAA